MTNAIHYASLAQGQTTDQVRTFLDTHNVRYQTKPNTGAATEPLATRAY